MLISIKVNDPTRTCMNLDTSITSFNVPFPLVMRTLESMSQVYQDLFLTMIPPQERFNKRQSVLSSISVLMIAGSPRKWSAEDEDQLSWTTGLSPIKVD